MVRKVVRFLLRFTEDQPDTGIGQAQQNGEEDQCGAPAGLAAGAAGTGFGHGKTLLGIAVFTAGMGDADGYAEEGSPA